MALFGMKWTVLRVVRFGVCMVSNHFLVVRVVTVRQNRSTYVKSTEVTAPEQRRCTSDLKTCRLMARLNARASRAHILA